MNQTILGFQSAFVSENIFASTVMYHQRSYVCFFKWIFCNLYKIRLASNIYNCLLHISSIGLTILNFLSCEKGHYFAL